MLITEKMKHNGTLYSTATKQRSGSSIYSSDSFYNTNPGPTPTYKSKRRLFNQHLQKKQFLQCDVPAFYKDMAWMENVQVFDLTTGTPAINIDETSQDTNFGTNSPQLYTRGRYYRWKLMMIYALHEERGWFPNTPFQWYGAWGKLIRFLVK